MSRQPDHYLILGLKPTATLADIHVAARTLADKFPPEARDPGVNAAYRQLLVAYEVLSDPIRRAEYDEMRAQQAPGLLEISVQPSRRKVAAMSTQQLLYLLATLRATEQSSNGSLPLNLAFVFDRSTSMAEERLAKVKAAAREVVHKLSPQDYLTIISFSDRAEVVWQSSRVEQREQLIGQINGIQASGGTEIFQGLDAGIRELSRWPLDRSINQLILLTDGHTYGDEAKCLALARQAAERGIALSAFGIGADWNDAFLDQLVMPSGGRSAYIDSPSQIAGYLREQISGLGAIYAHNVRLNLTLPAGARCSDAIKLSPYALLLEPNSSPMQLGAVEARAPLSLLFEVVLDPRQRGQELEFAFEFTMDIPGAHLKDRSFWYKERISVVNEAHEDRPAPIVLRAVQMLSLHRMSEKAWNDFEAGHTELATKRMRALTTRLLEAGQPELAEQAKLEEQRLSQMGTLSLQGRKRLKYGTRSLITAALGPLRRD